MTSFTFESRSEVDTIALGAALAEALPPNSVVALDGTLGAGKTRLVQAIAASLGIDRRDVVSPTFVLLQEYHGRRSIYHIDAYRIKDDDEFWQLGVDEYFAGSGLVFIEWAERVERCLPEQRLSITIEVIDETTRQFTLTSQDDRNQQVIADVASRLTITK
jgi:tRNA threonylcarbamoyladenosine biosynthesis protein TsaE